VVWAEGRRIWGAEQGQCESQLLGEDFKGAPRPGLSVSGETPQRRAPHQYGLSADRERDRDVGPTPNPAVEQNRDPAFHGLDDLGQRVDRRRRIV
jgi:hypothetical protein